MCNLPNNTFALYFKIILNKNIFNKLRFKFRWSTEYSNKHIQSVIGICVQRPTTSGSGHENNVI